MMDSEKAFGKVLNGVCVLTVKGAGKVNGMSAAWFTRVSHIPPLIAVSVGLRRHTRNLIVESKCFCVNMLAEGQVDVARHFGFSSGRDHDKFEGLDYSTAKTGSPVLEGTAGYLDCRLHKMCEAGDHVIFVGEVIASEAFDRPPLLARMEDYS
jgi:flavin reductase (DIM6/NTAB) family NADH-FMN oxidoreductase RutF